MGTPWHRFTSAYSMVGPCYASQCDLDTSMLCTCHYTPATAFLHLSCLQPKNMLLLGHAGRLDILHLLLEHQQSLAWLRCEGSTPLHMASCLCGIPAKREQGLEAAKLLLMSKASVFDKYIPDLGAQHMSRNILWCQIPLCLHNRALALSHACCFSRRAD